MQLTCLKTVPRNMYIFCINLNFTTIGRNQIGVADFLILIKYNGTDFKM